MQVELVRRAQRGDDEAFAALVSPTAKRFLGIAYRILRDPDLAEDATQQALLIIWRKLPTLRDPANFDAWSYRLLVNACYAESNKRPRVTPLRLVNADAAVIDTTSQAIDRVRLERAFMDLSLAHRAVVVLHLHVGLPFDEIAAALAVPVGTARSRLHYALRALRADIGSADEQHQKRGLA